MEHKIIIGSRGSKLALWQAEFVKAELDKVGVPSEISVIKTKGDVIDNVSFDKIEGKGFFTKEIEQALLDGEIDLAVHSYKDLPTESDLKLCIAANSYREDPADVLYIDPKAIDESQPFKLKEGATVGTSSSRRVSQLKFFRPDLNFVPIRGNVPTRIGKVGKDNIDAVVLAAAGVSRLKLDTGKLVIESLNPSNFVPAPAQGILAYQCRDDDQSMKAILAKIHDKKVGMCVELERKILTSMQGGCQTPIGIYCKKEIDDYLLWFYYQDEDRTKRYFFRSPDQSAIEKMALPLAKEEKRKRVFITRELKEDSLFTKSLVRRGHKVSSQSLIVFKKVLFKELPKSEWIFFSSKKGVRYFFTQMKKKPQDVKFACLGQGTAAELKKRLGGEIDFIGEGNRISEIAEKFLEVAKGATVVFPIAENSMRSIQKGLEGNIKAIDLTVYRNSIRDKISDPVADILVFTSPLNAKAYYQKVPIDQDQTVVAIGHSTARQLQALNIKKVRIAYSPDELSLANCCY